MDVKLLALFAGDRRHKNRVAASCIGFLPAHGCEDSWNFVTEWSGYLGRLVLALKKCQIRLTNLSPHRLLSFEGYPHRMGSRPALITHKAINDSVDQPPIAGVDVSAVRECIDQYGGLVWYWARRLSRTPADAEDATQEMFFQIWRQAGCFENSLGSEKNALLR